MVLRGESRRIAQLPDLVILSLLNEGPTPCEVLTLIMRNGKANKHHKVEYMGPPLPALRPGLLLLLAVGLRHRGLASGEAVGPQALPTPAVLLPAQ